MAEEKLSNIRTVRSFAMESREINNYKLTMDNVLQKAYKEAMINAKFYGMTGIISMRANCQPIGTHVQVCLVT